MGRVRNRRIPYLPVGSTVLLNAAILLRSPIRLLRVEIMASPKRYDHLYEERAQQWALLWAVDYKNAKATKEK